MYSLAYICITRSADGSLLWVIAFNVNDTEFKSWLEVVVHCVPISGYCYAQKAPLCDDNQSQTESELYMSVVINQSINHRLLFTFIVNHQVTIILNKAF